MADEQKQRGMWGDLSRLLTGSMAGYAVLLAASPILTRLFSPEVFGGFAVFSGYVAVASVFMTLGFDMGIVNAARTIEARRFLGMAVASTILVGAALSVVLGAAAGFGADFGLPLWAMFLAILSCLAASLATIAISWSIKRGKAAQAARINFLSLTARSGVQIVLGISGLALSGLILGEVAGRGLAALSAERALLWRNAANLFQRPKAVIAQMWRARGYPLVVTPALAIDTALVWLPAPLFALWFDPFAAGLIALVQRFGAVPLTIANQTLGQVFHQRASEAMKHNSLLLIKFIAVATLATLPLAALAMLLLHLFGTQVMAAIFGADWGMAGYVAMVLVPVYAVQFFAILYNRVFLLRGMLRAKLATSALHLVVMVGVLSGAASLGLAWHTALIALSAGLVFSYGLAMGVALWGLARAA